MKVKLALALFAGLLVGATVTAVTVPKVEPECGCKVKCECKPCRCAGTH